jgi:hypothetical protein
MGYEEVRMLSLGLPIIMVDRAVHLLPMDGNHGMFSI